MKSLSKEQRATHVDVLANLRAAYDELTAATIAYNEALSGAREHCEHVVEGIECYTSERSDAWQDSDAASTMESWRDAWDTLGSDLNNLDEPDESPITALESAPMSRDDA